MSFVPWISARQNRVATSCLPHRHPWVNTPWDRSDVLMQRTALKVNSAADVHLWHSLVPCRQEVEHPPGEASVRPVQQGSQLSCWTHCWNTASPLVLSSSPLRQDWCPEYHIIIHFLNVNLARAFHNWWLFWALYMDWSFITWTHHSN